MWKRKWRLLNEDDGSGDPGDGSAPEDASKPPAFDPAQLHGVLSTLATSMKGFQDNLGALASRLDELETKRGSHEPPKDNLDDMDFDAMTNKELVSALTAKFGKLVEQHLAPISEKVEGFNGELKTRDLKAELSNLAAQHKDLPEWKEEMLKLVEETPGLSFKRAYAIVRQENPEKAAKLDKKYNPPSDSGTGPRRLFGGLPPGSRTGGDKNTKMKFDQAAEQAWNNVLGQYGEAAKSLLTNPD